MRILIHLNTSGKISTYSLIVFYIFLVALDIYTTYLVTPNLMLEANPVIVHFDLNWLQIILLAAVFTGLMSISYVYAIEYVHKHFHSIFSGDSRSSMSQTIRNKKMLISFFIMGSFFTHLTCSVFVVINNYFGYLFLFGIRNFLHSTAVTYITVKSLLQSLFFLSIYSFLILFSFLCAFVIIIIIGHLSRTTTPDLSQPLQHEYFNP